MDELVLLDLCEVCVKPLVPSYQLIAKAEARHQTSLLLHHYLEAIEAPRH